MASNKRGGYRAGARRPVKPIQDRAVVRGKIAIRIHPEAAIQLQRLMLRDIPGVRTPEDMIEYLIQKELAL